MKNKVETIIEPKSGINFIDWKELYRYRDLFLFMAWRDIKVLYKQTILGFSWAILRPVLGMVIFTIIFGKMAKLPNDGIPYPVFYYAALVPWTYFSDTLTASTNSLINNFNMLSKVYFPRIVIPISPVVAKLVDFTIAFTILIGMMFWYGFTPGFKVVFIPYLVLIMILTVTGAGLWLSSLAIQYRDVRHAGAFITQFLLFAAPVVWPTSMISEKFGHAARLVYGLYPMAGVIEGFRSLLIGTTEIPWDLIFLGNISALIIALTGALYFRRIERIIVEIG